MTVVRRDTRRRWLVVLALVATLVAVPVGLSARPVHSPAIAVAGLLSRIMASAQRPYAGYVESVGALGLPELPRLGQVAALVSGTTRMRAWYADRDNWRVDVLDTGSEKGFYQTPDGQYAWDFAANQLTYVAAPQPSYLRGRGDPSTMYLMVEPPARLPRAGDLVPPELARRLLSTATGERVVAIPAKRVAGKTAAGLRITSADPHSTIGHIDVWADPTTGLPVQVEVSAKGAQRPILVTRFLDLRQTRPAAADLAAPPIGNAVNYTATWVANGLDQLFEPTGVVSLPPSLAGQTRRDQDTPPPTVTTPAGQWVQVVRYSPIGIYGTGLSQFVVLPLANRLAGEVYRTAQPWGQTLTFPNGTGVLLATPVLSVLILRLPATRQTYLVAGMVDSPLVQQVATELAGTRR
jgi:hypothetical protein